MRILPQPLEIGENEGFSSDKDLFKRESLGRGMSNLVAKIDDPLVIAFDGVWGSGKTTFLKMWAGELRKAGHPVVFFDAFENDYVEDAFAALARELIELAEEKAPKDEAITKDFKEKTIGLGKLLLRGGAKVGVKAAVRAASMGFLKESDLKEVADDITSEAEDAAGAYIEQLLEQPKQQKETVKRFRNALEELPSLLSPPSDGERQKPLIYIIDELDRCKPHFALALLERIKHFMAVPNVHFVLGLHLLQLENSVRYAYGTEIDAHQYLQKFINLTVLNIENVGDAQQGDLDAYANLLAKQLKLPFGHDNPTELSIEIVKRLLKEREASFRTMERAFTQLTTALLFTSDNQLRLGAIIGGLVAMKILEPKLFSKAKRGIITLDEVRLFLNFQKQQGRPLNMSFEEQWWTYCLAENAPAELESMETVLFRFNVVDRKSLITFTANQIVDRLKPD